MEGEGDLSEEDIDRIVREMLRGRKEDVKKNLSSWDSFKQFLKNAGLMYIYKKVGDGIGAVLGWLADVFFS